MKIFLPNESKQTQGGAWSFRNTLERQLRERGHEVFCPELECHDLVSPPYDISLISSASMVTKDYARKLRENSKKLILRVDNALRNSRNSNDGMNRMKMMAEMSDKIVYQSQWARNYLKDFLGKDGQVIYNGVDKKIFQPMGSGAEMYDWRMDGSKVFLYSRFNEDPTKRWEWAWWAFQQIHKQIKNALLVLVGRFDKDFGGNPVSFNFDFFNGEKIKYLGVIEDPHEMAKIYRSCDYFLATYSNDCYSNTYCEALMCGMQMAEASLTGGTPELLENWRKYGVKFFDAKRMVEEYEQLFNELLS